MESPGVTAMGVTGGIKIHRKCWLEASSYCVKRSRLCQSQAWNAANTHAPGMTGTLFPLSGTSKQNSLTVQEVTDGALLVKSSAK